MSELHGGRTDALEVSPNLWAGVGLVRGGAGTALVGSHEEVADRIAEYHELGIDEFILSGYPHLEEAYQVGEGVMPVLRRRGLGTPFRRPPRRQAGPGTIQACPGLETRILDMRRRPVIRRGRGAASPAAVTGASGRGRTALDLVGARARREADRPADRDPLVRPQPPTG